MTVLSRIFRRRPLYAVIYFVGHPDAPIAQVAGPFPNAPKAMAARDIIRRKQYKRGARWDHEHLAHAVPLDRTHNHSLTGKGHTS